MLIGVGYQVQTYHCAFFFSSFLLFIFLFYYYYYYHYYYYYYYYYYYFLFLVMNAHTLVINKSYSNEKLKRMNKIPQITNEHMKPLSHETTFHAKVSKSIPNDGMQRVIRLPYMHQYVKNQHSK